MKKRSGFTMIATLITVAIICILMVVMMQGYGTGSTMPDRKDGKGKTIYGGVMMSAKDQVCKSNLSQVRQAIEAAKLSGDGNPAELSGAGIGESFYHCPVGNEPYQYDANTGQVHCPHPGHENF
jgi:competence protein ComGC